MQSHPAWSAAELHVWRALTRSSIEGLRVARQESIHFVMSMSATTSSARAMISVRGCVSPLGWVGSQGHGVARGERATACRGGWVAGLSCCGGSCLLLRRFSYRVNRIRGADGA